MPRILIVDDSPTSRATVRQILQRHGFTTSEAGDGEEALASVAADPPDLVLMDVVMPGVNGFQATRKLVRNPSTAGIPIVILTSKTQPTDRIWGMRQGARGYLTKPVSEAGLLSTVRSLLGLRRAPEAAGDHVKAGA